MLTYQEALDWIYSFIDSEKKLPQTPLDFNLPRVRALLAALGDPQTRYPAVVVAGTKGKGSTCAMLESIIRAAGIKVGLFTSPHLHSYRERMQIDRAMPSQAELAGLVEQIQPVAAALDPGLGRLSTYELGVALGLLWFAQQAVEFAVLEIGLGGRYDAINTVTPLLSVIASISYDHTAILGDTLALIAGEKAGIVKPGVPVLTTVQPAEAAEVIAATAAAHEAPLFVATLGGLREQASGEQAEYPLEIVPAALGLKGDFQMQNAQLAAGAALILRELGLPLSDDAIRRGLAEVSWPARLEQIGERPAVVADGAHNGESARVLLQALRGSFAFDRLILVLGTSSDKDIAGIARELVPAAAAVVLIQSRHPRATPTAVLREHVARLAAGPVEERPDIPPALELARELAGPNDLICVTGSLFVAAAAREAVGLGDPD
ncbi:MAG TPA: folylpolyglutamate synthase/dihydrofolate synthase family protein [Herpetosiphonaceae bacterium]|nr:folylpolyglutamate synthase/dihydrofolate synthase family protein [Herpetosiphonaceae bacterium]